MFVNEELCVFSNSAISPALEGNISTLQYLQPRGICNFKSVVTGFACLVLKAVVIQPIIPLVAAANCGLIFKC